MGVVGRSPNRWTGYLSVLCGPFLQERPRRKGKGVRGWDRDGLPEGVGGEIDREFDVRGRRKGRGVGFKGRRTSD